ncbi:riboflavin kinase [Rummeliibacillus suwonensis]|jgi:riboflavin kinase/FMN adenylyltransferase|uniref:riboflavin kinase n=1 Tax=Rummeliibacillus suwonensis TaxID=1306154 RepID=UPI0011B6DF34|nr:riboflavin kinase [Rummeliibacillus suwonensis]
MNALHQFNEHLIVGHVEKGKQLGRKIGFPTANLNLVEELMIDKGVYGVYVYHHSKKYLGIMNVGNRPTFNDGDHQTFEVHILDFHECIYDEYLTIEVMFYIRNEIKFDQLQDLINQLQADAFYARKKFRLLQ